MPNKGHPNRTIRTLLGTIAPWAPVSKDAATACAKHLLKAGDPPP
jgi:hypothetical protein